MEIKIKKLHPDAVIPSYSKLGDAGQDLVCVSRHFDEDGNVVYGTGLAFEIPEGFVGLLFPRSSNAKKDLTLSNSVGVLDSSYRGEVSFKFKPAAFFADDAWAEPGTVGNVSETFDYTVLPKGYNQDDSYGFSLYEIGDRIGQIIIMPYPQVTFEEVSELSSTERGEGGFGSTGK
jgi:dUTP pyrophosphatase